MQAHRKVRDHRGYAERQDVDVLPRPGRADGAAEAGNSVPDTKSDPAKTGGCRQVAPDTTRIHRWTDGEHSRPSIPALFADALRGAASRSLTPGDIGLTTTKPELGGIQLPSLTEVTAQTPTGWAQMNLVMIFATPRKSPLAPL